MRVGSGRGAFASVVPLIASMGTFGPVVQILPGAISTLYEAEVAKVRAALGEEAIATPWRLGQALSLEETIGEALALADSLLNLQS